MSTPETWFKQGESLLAANQYGSTGFSQGLELLKKSAAAGFIDAQVTLGHVHAQVHLLPNAFQEAARWYQLAAERGHPMAQDRLADLFMLGRGVSQSDAQAFAWYARTAAQAYAMAQCNLAYMHSQGLGTPVDQEAATSMFLRAAAQGEARAYFNLGLRYYVGLGALAGPVHACAWMSNAARLNYPTARTELESMRASLNDAQRVQARELAALIEANFEALQYRLGRTPGATSSIETYRQTVEENFASLAVPELALDAAKRLHGAGRNNSKDAAQPQPGQPDTVNQQPRIFTLMEFVSKAEAAHLMALALLNMKSSAETVRDQLSQEHTAFTGHSANFHLVFCDAVVRNLERRIASAFNLPVEHVEPISVLRYQHSHQYAAHVDYFDEARLEYNRRIGDKSGQRIASFLVYLQAPEAGGQTHYLKLKLKVEGKPRMALCHFNLTSEGATDPMTLHTGEPVIAGEKWLARTTLREKPFF
ncbi:MAG: SEL1-like repeat protein [Gammaproteobacteria bacterium]|nr:SEL1-like repeat protein [Gammaproteobacteria bacterium]